MRGREVWTPAPPHFGVGFSNGTLRRTYSHPLEPLPSRQVKPWTPAHGYVNTQMTPLPPPPRSRAGLAADTMMARGLTPSYSLPNLPGGAPGGECYIGVTAW